MINQEFINLIAGAILMTLGWFARQLWQAVKQLQKDLQRLEVLMPSRYVEKTDLQLALRDIKDSLERIEDKLDRKVDKP